MLTKFVSSFNRNMLFLGLFGVVALVGALSLGAGWAWPVNVAQAADVPSGVDAGAAQAAITDRISFYNVPSDNKLESHLDYADGRSEKILYAAGLCAPGTVITQQLNLYTVKFVAEGCSPTVFQNLNLRWMGACQFELEHDPDVRMVARGSYGETVIGDGHYPAGPFELTNLPANTTSLSANMTFTNPLGIVQTGNVEFSFNTPHPGCGQATTPTPTSTATLTGTVETATPTSTATATPTSTATLTGTVETATPTSTATATPTSTATLTGTVETATPTPTSTATPTLTATATPGGVVLPPTGLDPVVEPGAPLPPRLYLPLVGK